MLTMTSVSVEKCVFFAFFLYSTDGAPQTSWGVG